MFGFMSKKDKIIAVLTSELLVSKLKIKNKDIMLKNMLNERDELKEKITDLENNVEFLVNNLSAAKRKQLGL